MSYSIYIGEAAITEDPDGGLEITVDKIELPDAPLFPGDEMTGKTNGRHPGYSQWYEFTDAAGLHDLFYDDDTGLLVPHPGCRRLTRKHLEAFSAAETVWLADHPNKIPGWDPKHEPFSRTPTDPRYDGNAARLIWLRWWTAWTLKNCKNPTMSNY